jgi:glyoxylase-like metal-dependent hydrolase (beta-lactamase superfamily II)
MIPILQASHHALTALPMVEKFFPGAHVIAHPATLQRILLGSLAGKPTSPTEFVTNLSVGKIQLQALFTPGHTDSHVCVWEPRSG